MFGAYPLGLLGPVSWARAACGASATAPAARMPRTMRFMVTLSRAGYWLVVCRRCLVGWAESSRPTVNPPRLPVGLEDSAHPTKPRLLVGRLPPVGDRVVGRAAEQGHAQEP